MSWRTVRLGDLVDNFSVRAKDVGGADGLDFYGVSNVEGIIKTKYAAEDKAEDYKIIEKGCFAYNPYRVNVGSIGLISDDSRGLISPAYVVFKPKPNAIIPELLFKFLKSDEGLRQIKFYARGTVRQALRFEDLCNIEVTIPEFEEQQILYDKLIKSQEASNVLDAELKTQLELLKKLRQQLLQDAVQGKLVKQNPKDEPASELLKKIKAEKLNRVGLNRVGLNRVGLKPNSKNKTNALALKGEANSKGEANIKPEEIPFEIPDNWVWCRLGDVGKITGGGTPSMANEEYWNGNIPWVSPKDMWTEFVTDTEMKVTPKGINESSTNLIPVGSLLIVGRSGILKRKLPVAINSVECTVNQDMKVIIPHLIEMNRFLQFMFWGLESIILKEYVKFGMTVHSLKYDEFSQMPIPLPPLSEQIRIVQKLDELMHYCNELEASIKQSESQNSTLLQQVLREALRKEPVEA